jgi:hypothetical protein
MKLHMVNYTTTKVKKKGGKGRMIKKTGKRGKRQ